MSKQHYVMLFNDPACPGFCSTDKPFFGTKEHYQMLKWLMQEYEGCEETVIAIENYFHGQRCAEHYIAHKYVPILKRIKVFASENLRFEDKTWEHFNIWGFTYKMRCDSGLAKQIIVKYEGKYCRCLRVWFKNLCYEDTSGAWSHVDSFWGNKELMMIYHYPSVDIKINNILYIVDKKYDTIEEARQSLSNVDELSFKYLCDEIFADG